MENDTPPLNKCPNCEKELLFNDENHSVTCRCCGFSVIYPERLYYKYKERVIGI